MTDRLGDSLGSLRVGLEISTQAYVEGLICHPWRVISLAVAIIVLVTIGAAKLSVTNDFRAYFGPNNPELADLNHFEETYERQQNVVIVVLAPQTTIFTRDALQLIAELTKMGWQVPYSRRVTSLANYQHTRAQEHELVVTSLVTEPAGLSGADIAQIKAIALAEPGIVNRLVSAAGQATLVTVALSLPAGNPRANARAVQYVEAAIKPLQERFSDIEMIISGTTATDVALGQAVQRDIETLVGLSYLVIVLGLLVLLRHVGGVVATLVVITSSIAMTMGIFGWLGATLEPTAGFVPSIVMTIAVADSVHLLSTFYYELRSGKTKSDAVRESLRVNANPIALTSITTAIGVLMLNFSDSPPYNELGNMIAVGVCAAWLLSMSLLPALIVVLPVKHVTRGKALELWMSALAEWLIGQRLRVLVTMTAVVLIIASFIPDNRIGEQWHEYFDDTFSVQRAIDKTAQYMGGLHLIHYDLRSGKEDGLHAPEYLRDVEAFALWLEQQPEVANVDRLTQLLARLHMNMHADDVNARVLPDNRELAAQLLLLYELSLPLGMGLENTVDMRRSASRMTVSLKRTDSEQLIAFDQRAAAWLSTNAQHITPTHGTGIDLIFAHINHRNIVSLLGGMVLALVLISIVLVIALRSFKLGMLSLVTNLAPAGLAYGTWAMISGRIDLSASVVICMSIGIVVDDTVHFLSKYRRARYEAGKNSADALRYTFHTVGVALTITTCILVAGFAVLTASHFQPTVTTGALMAITLAFALVVDFLFLPPLLLTVDSGRARMENTRGASQAALEKS